ncbi:hypothetical protein ABW636_07160 [Aquimarina sp. 2201CG1-2-11]|uniref:hypothetical protein n=1 Tax=Aquimarina discodermiae TaxID=3231043 RepID=UPI0034618554
MKTHKFLFSFFTIAIMGLVFTSCEKEEIQETDTTGEDLDEIKALEEIKVNNDISVKSTLSYTNALRYYSGGRNTVHTYKVANSGAAIGTYEGIAFRTPIVASSNGVDRNEYNFLYFLLHPRNEDFMMTTSAREYWSLRRSGWNNLTHNYVLIHKNQKTGLKRLYRFYGHNNSDHLFTTNYSEGTRAGYRYEGVVGWVK